VTWKVSVVRRLCSDDLCAFKAMEQSSLEQNGASKKKKSRGVKNSRGDRVRRVRIDCS
jgi:hypothetical protein